MPSARTKSGPGSDGELSSVARHLILPTGIVSTGWPGVRDRCASMDIEFDPWQDGMGRAILAKRRDGLYAAGIGGVEISICRQVGKTFTIGSTVFALCINTPGLKVVWTAHRTRTSDETFKSLQGMAKRKKVAPFVDRPRQANGQQEIPFKNGSRIMFGARESGFGRGFDEVDVLVFDEAQILTQKALDDMVPATNVSANPLILMMGTPPKPTDPSEAFTTRRREALAGKSQDAMFLEFSADPDADLKDRAQWRKGNPSYPHRTPESSMLRMWRQLGDESFRREGLGIWDEAALDASALSADAWADLAIPASKIPTEGRKCFAARFTMDGSRVALAAAMRPKDGPVHVEGIKLASMSDGLGWLVDYLEARWRETAQIVVEGKAGAGWLVAALREAGVPAKVIWTPTADQAVTAHAMLPEAITQKAITHIGQDELDDEVGWATKRKIGNLGGFGWAAPEGQTVALLDAVTLAHWAARTTRRRPRGSSSGRSRVVVMS
jgi:hypothetical protein